VSVNKSEGISIVIPSFMGRTLLEKLLPQLKDACNKYPAPSEIIVVDNCSNDGTAELLADKFKGVRAVILPRNYGYGYACNTGVKAAVYPVIICITTDVEVDADFLKFVPEHFENNSVFAVKMKITGSGNEDPGDNCEWWGHLSFKYGWFSMPFRSLPKGDSRLKLAASVAGAAAAFDRDKFLSIGGFDDLFLPFYGEETDLCYRALKRGWSIEFEPRSIVRHIGQATISVHYSRRMVETTGERNMYFLIWKNIHSRDYMLLHLLFIPVRIVRGILFANPVPLSGFIKAMPFLPEVLRKRQEEKKHAVRKDGEIFEFFG